MPNFLPQLDTYVQEAADLQVQEALTVVPHGSMIDFVKILGIGPVEAVKRRGGSASLSDVAKGT